MRLIWTLVLFLFIVPGLDASAETEPSSVKVARNALFRHLSSDEWADVCFLEHLGWRVVPTPGLTDIQVHAGKPCTRENIEAARAAGDLELRVPVPLGEDAVRRFAAKLESVALSLGSRGAYQLKLDAPLTRAVDKLSRAANGGNGRYGFPDLFGITFPTFQCKPPKPEWVETDTGRIWRAGRTPSAAVASIYTRSSTIECYVAQWIAAYAAQYELYGADWFDRSFRREEIAIGTSRGVRETHFGKYLIVDREYPYTALMIPESEQEGNASRYLLEHGRKAFLGLGGIVKCEALGIDAFENFTIVSMSKAAADQLRKRGGFGWYEFQAKKIWAIDDEISGLFVNRRYKAKRQKEIDEMLADPAFSEMIVYVHPYGRMSMVDIVDKKLKQGTTPISVSLYTHGREDAFFRRYRDAVRARCLRRPLFTPERAGPRTD